MRLDDVVSAWAEEHNCYVKGGWIVSRKPRADEPPDDIFRAWATLYSDRVYIWNGKFVNAADPSFFAELEQGQKWHERIR